jgi:hypothetical protein
MEITIKVILDESPALINSFAALSTVIEKLVNPAAVDIKSPFDSFGTKVPVENVKTTNKVPVKNVTPATIAAPTGPVTAPAPVFTPAAPVIPTAPSKQYTLDEIQKACVPLMDGGKMAALATLVKEFGVPSMQAIPPERYGELVIKLRTLGAKL